MWNDASCRTISSRPVARFLALTVTILACVPAAAMGSDEARVGDERESYAFVRTIEGSATVADGALEQNQPLLTGDRIVSGPQSRLEILLPDRSRLLLDRETVIRLEQLAFSGDRESRVTVLALEEGEIILEVPDEALGDELPRVEAQGGTVYVQEPGTYRVAAGAGGWVELLARSGFAELVTERGSTIVRSGEMGLQNGDRWGRVELSRAESADELERWSNGLVERANGAGRSASHVGSELSYAAASLDEAGDWVVVENVNYWRPHVSVGWRPYWQGRWGWTPSGYTWVSYEPWGWVPYHYGRWSQLPGYGWAWRPGSVYSPAWVYWNWTDGYAGWVPVGYYTDFYRPWYGGGYRHGFYGWAGGSWGYYHDWNFAPVHCFRDRNFRGHVRTGRDLQRESRFPEAPRGLITTDTRDFRPDRIDRPDQILHEISGRNAAISKDELPDVTDFVGRKRELPDEVARIVGREGPKEPALVTDDVPRIATTPGWRAGKRDTREIRQIRTPEPGKITARTPVSSPAPSPAPPRTIRIVEPPRVADGNGRRAPESPGAGVVRAPETPTGNRQGWKDRMPVSAPTDPSTKIRYPRIEAPENGTTAARPRNPEPVERVISGTRRYNQKIGDGDTWSAPPNRSNEGSAPRVRSYPSAPSIGSGEGSGAPTRVISSPRISGNPPATRSPSPAEPRVVRSAPATPKGGSQVSSGTTGGSKPSARTSTNTPSRNSGGNSRSSSKSTSKSSTKSSSDDGGDRQ